MSEPPPPKRLRTSSPPVNAVDAGNAHTDPPENGAIERQKGEVAIKAQYLLPTPHRINAEVDDDAAESSKFKTDDRDGLPSDKKKSNKKNRGANYNRSHGTWGDKVLLCSTRVFSDEFSPEVCKYERCKYEHDLRKYLKSKPEDLNTFEQCPAFTVNGFCPSGWRCRFLSSHSKEVEREDGRSELVLLGDKEQVKGISDSTANEERGLYNIISPGDRQKIQKRQVTTEKADAYNKWLEIFTAESNRINHHTKMDDEDEITENGKKDAKEDNRAIFTDPPYRPSEKRRIYYGPETPTLAPLTTQGNLPFRRLCISLGAELTFSEMAMTMPLIQGDRGEWALVKAHETEVASPNVDLARTLPDYNHKDDLRFGIQISASKHWVALKGAEILSKYSPNLRVIDMNCGCPLDLVCNTGGGAQMIDSPSKMEKMLRGMGAVSGEIPITCKMRTGLKDTRLVADKVVERLVLGSEDSQAAGLGPSGVAAITLHGRTKQQRYTKLANWGYISEIGALIKRLQAKEAAAMDTVREVDPRDQPNGGKTYFLGNGDVFSHFDYEEHISQHQVDSVMIGRGALIKPWVFEEIKAGQYLDKSSTERLEYVKEFVKHGLDTWGSDEKGLGTTRRFLMEWLSFAHRYVPLGLLEHLPPRMNERPPPYQGRDELETLMTSPEAKDWTQIADMFLGKTPEDFKFVPKHKSNSYELETQG